MCGVGPVEKFLWYKEFSSLITVIITTLIDSTQNYYHGSWFFILSVLQGMKLSSEATVKSHHSLAEQRAEEKNSMCHCFHLQEQGELPFLQKKTVRGTLAASPCPLPLQ